MKSIAKRSDRIWVEMSGRDGTGDWRGSFLQCSQNQTYKQRSIVFVICSLSGQAQKQQLFLQQRTSYATVGKIAELAPNYSAHLITLIARAAFAG